MNGIFSRLRVPPPMLALLSLGISALPRMRSVRVPIARPFAETAASRLRSHRQSRR